jgi:hypothetical protein
VVICKALNRIVASEGDAIWFIECGGCGRECSARNFYPELPKLCPVTCGDCLRAAQAAGFQPSLRGGKVTITVPGDCVLVCTEVLGEGHWETADGAGCFHSHWQLLTWIKSYEACITV